MKGLQVAENVAKLLTIGEITRGHGRIHYERDFGISPADVEDLLRMAESPELNMGNSESAEVWAPIHAIRALGQLRAADTVPRLIRLIDDFKSDDWIRDELPDVFGEMGPTAIPGLKVALGDPWNTERTRVVAGNGLTKIALEFPECYAEAVDAFAGILEQMDATHAYLNGCLVCNLLDLKATETLPLIERLFRSNCVVQWVVDWKSVQIDLGTDLPDPSPKKVVDSRPDGMRPRPQPAPSSLPAKPESVRHKLKARRESRKQQRKAKAKARKAAKRKR